MKIMKTKEIEEVQIICKKLLIGKLLDYVRQHGEDVTDYERNEFGLGEDDEDWKVTKVLNFFDNGGCCFTLGVTNGIAPEFVTYAVHCLYIVEDEGEEHLMSYSLYNVGTEYNSEASEPDHDYMINECMSYVEHIADMIVLNFK